MMDDYIREVHCSFCGKPQSLVERLIAGNGAYICDPEAQYEIGGYNFYMQPIGNTVLNYIR